MDRRDFLKAAAGVGVAAVVPATIAAPLECDTKAGTDLIRFLVNYADSTVTATFFRSGQKEVITKTFKELRENQQR